MPKEIIDMLKKVGRIDEHLEYIMSELEHCDDMIYNENLSAANYIYWMARKECLLEMRDNYCKSREE